VSRDITAHIRVVGFARVMSLATAVFPRDGFRFLRKRVKVKSTCF
jgi:HD-like signal output (HDOD) protein